MACRKPKGSIWIISDAETHGGGPIRAESPEAALEQATRKYPNAWFKAKPKRVKVESFAGQDHVSKHWFNVV